MRYAIQFLVVLAFPVVAFSATINIPADYPTIQQIPATGVSIVPLTIPSTFPSPVSIPMQALIGAELSNLSMMEVQ